MLRGMQCGATALILNVGIDLAVKQCKKKLALPLLILLVTFIGNAFFQLNIMTLIVLDGLVGFFFMRTAKYN